jgi:hypothetical protein
MKMLDFGVSERADVFELVVVVFVESCVTVFPDICSVFSESFDRSDNSVLASVALDEARSGGMNGGCTCQGGSQKAFDGLMPSNLFLFLESLHQNRLKV